MAKMASIAAEMEDLPDEYLEQLEEVDTSVDPEPVVVKTVEKKAKTHKVVDGDSYASIAAKYADGRNKFAYANELVKKNNGKQLTPGSVVTL
jgi:LysM repeat protein